MLPLEQDRDMQLACAGCMRDQASAPRQRARPCVLRDVDNEVVERENEQQDREQEDDERQQSGQRVAGGASVALHRQEPR